MNALDEKDDTGISLEKKEQIKCGLNKMANDHYYIMSSLANKQINIASYAKAESGIEDHTFWRVQ
jgi:hypothetical protein